MRPTVGLSTLPQRLAGMRTAAPMSANRTGQVAAMSVPSTSAGGPPAPGGASFASALNDAMGAGAAFSGTGLATPGMPPQLGPGLRFAPDGALITPQMPGAGAVPAGVPHVCSQCSPGLAPAGGVGGAGGVGVVGAPRSGPPPELQAYGNGRIPPAALESLGVGDHSLWSPAARAFRDMSAAAAAEGVSLGINSSYRSYEGQVAMVERFGLYSQGGRAAAPGTSNHGWGVSVDLQLDDRARQWMRANAGRFGFVEDVPREPWHWTFTAASY